MQLGLTLSLGAPQRTAINTLDYLLEYTSGNIDLSGMGGRYATSDANSDGIYVDGVDFNSADLASGPVNVVPPSYTGTASSGNTVTWDPGVWIYSASDGEPVITLQWQRAGSDIAGETNETYAVVADDEALGLSIEETATNGAGAVPATGVVIAIPRVTSLVDNVATEYIVNPYEHTPASKTTVTFVILVEFNNTATADENIWDVGGANYIKRAPGGELEARFISSTGQTILLWTDGDVSNTTTIGAEKAAIMIAVDATSGNDSKVYLNNVEEYTDNRTSTYLDEITGANSNRFFRSKFGGGGADVNSIYLAIYDGYIDPALHWGEFFVSDGAGSWDALGRTGTVQGVSPYFVMKGAATDYDTANWDVDTASATSSGTGWVDV